MGNSERRSSRSAAAGHYRRYCRADRREDADRLPKSNRSRSHRADGRVLAEDLIAPIDVPAFDNSAVDGYAVAFSDSPYRTAKPPCRWSRVSQPVEEPTPRSCGAGRRGFSPARRCRRAPTPCSCRKTCGSRRPRDFARGLALGANRGAVAKTSPRLRSRSKRASASIRASSRSRRLSASPIALRPAARRGIFDRRRIVAAGRGVAAGQTRFQPFCAARAAGQQGCRVGDLGILRDDQVAISQSLATAANSTTSS